MSRSRSPKRRRQVKAHNDVQVCQASGRKIRHASKKKAKQEMNRLLASRRVGAAGDSRPLPNAVYKCPFCRDWHLTSGGETKLPARACARCGVHLGKAHGVFCPLAGLVIEEDCR